MKLQTKIPLQPENNQIDYQSKVLLLGSCFAQNIGERFEYFKFQNLQNPFGIMFHPLAIEKLVTRAINEIEFTEEDVFFHNEQWHSFEVHSELSNSEKAAFLILLNGRLKALREYLLSASHIIFTLGTAWGYRFIETDAMVANCHKIPQQQFLKELLSVNEVSVIINNTITGIKGINPQANFIMTVSPVRHIKDGFVANSLSKAHLLSGIHNFLNQKSSIANRQSYYFPSYEIVMDELRDYRFYAEDMVHLTKTAITIIWERFKEVWIASETETLQKEIDGIQKGLQHRPFNSNSEEYQLFSETLQKRITALQQNFPHLKFL